MAPRFVLPKHLPIRAAFAGKRTPAFARFNSDSSSSTSRAAQVVEMARSAQKPGPLEASVPVVWLLSGVLGVFVFNRLDGLKEDYVEKLLIV